MQHIVRAYETTTRFSKRLKCSWCNSDLRVTFTLKHWFLLIYWTILLHENVPVECPECGSRRQHIQNLKL